MHTMDHTEIGISSAGGGRQGELNIATRIFWKSFKIHLVEVYLIKIVFLMVYAEEEDPVVSNQSNLDFIKVGY